MTAAFLRVTKDKGEEHLHAGFLAQSNHRGHGIFVA